MTKQINVPRRTALPENVSYILLNKNSFVELMANFVAAIESQTGSKQSIDIYVDGFDGSFESAGDVANTLTTKEWIGLTSIRVSIADKDNHANRISLNFGNYSYRRAGLRIEYGKGNTDVERLVIKEKIDSFMTDYYRAVWLNDRVIPAFFSVVTFCALLIWIYTTASDEFYDKSSPWNHINLVWVGVLIAGCTYLLTAFCHRIIIPHFETINDDGLTRAKKISRIIVNVAFVVGLASGLLALIEWMF